MIRPAASASESEVTTMWRYKNSIIIFFVCVPKASPIPKARKKMVRKYKRWNDH